MVMRSEGDVPMEVPSVNVEKRESAKRNRRSLHVPLKSASPSTTAPPSTTLTTTVTLHNSNPAVSRVTLAKPEEPPKLNTAKITPPKESETSTAKKRRSFPAMSKMKQQLNSEQQSPPLSQSPSQSPTQQSASPRKSVIPSTKSEKSPRIISNPVKSDEISNS